MSSSKLGARSLPDRVMELAVSLGDFGTCCPTGSLSKAKLACGSKYMARKLPPLYQGSQTYR